MTSLFILIEKGSSVLKMRLHLSAFAFIKLSAFAFMKLFANYSKSTFPTYSFSRATLTFSKHTYGVLSSV